MRRRALLAGLTLSTPAQAQRQRPVIGILLNSDRQQFPGWPDHPVLVGLRELGWIDGDTATIVVEELRGRFDRVPSAVATLLAQRPAVLLGAGPPAISEMSRATNTVPIVMAVISDAVADGFVASLARPGGTITGLSMQNRDLIAKRLGLLHEVVPAARRFAIFHEPSMAHRSGLAEMIAAARARGADPLPLEVEPGALRAAFQRAVQEHAEALIVLPTPRYNQPAIRRALGTLAIEHRLPSMSEEAAFVRDGGLMSYGPDFAAMYKRSASFVDRILRGAHPATLPVENPVKFDLVLNRRTGDALGLTLPLPLLAQAEAVIE